MRPVNVYFTDWFGIDPAVLAEYGAFNVSLINDLPLFIDPFLLFTSGKPEYRQLHDRVIDYLKFLRDRAAEGTVDDGLLRSWYLFPEVKELWLGFSLRGNSGSGLVARHGRNGGRWAATMTPLPLARARRGHAEAARETVAPGRQRRLLAQPLAPGADAGT